MENMSEKELNRYIEMSYNKFIIREKSKKKSKTMQKYIEKKGEIDILDEKPEILDFDDYLLSIKKDDLIIDNEENGFDELNKSEMDSPTKDDDIVIYTNIKALEESEKADNRSNFKVIRFEGDNGIPFDLIVDNEGKDIGVITYDEKGEPNFKMDSDIKKDINFLIDQSRARDYVEESTIQKEFFYQDFDSLVRAINEGKLVPDSVKDVGKRAISAKNIKDKNYTEIDEKNAITESPAEIDKKAGISSRENEREITKELRENEVIEEDEVTLKPQTKPKLVKVEPDNKNEIDEDELNKKEDDEKEESDNKNIPSEAKNVVEKFCNDNDISESKIQAVLIVKEANSLDDLVDNANITRNGNEVIVIQYSDSVSGRSAVAMIQDGAEIRVDKPHETAEKLIDKYHIRSGIIKRVEDNDSRYNIDTGNGNIQSEQLKRKNKDMSLDEKKAFIKDLEADLEKLKDAKEEVPRDETKIESLKKEIYRDFIVAGLEIPEVLNEIEEPTVQEAEEEEIEEDDGYDPRDHRAGDPRGQRYK